MAWYYNSAGPQTLTGTVDNDVFQLGTNNSVGGVQAGWDTYVGGAGYDQIWVAPKSGYSWTAVMIENNGLDGIEAIVNYTTGPAPVYFRDYVDFSEIITLTSNIKVYGRGGNDVFDGGTLGEYVEGDDGNDILNGNGGDDILYGDTANNPWAVNWGAAGADQLNGGDGNDQLFGQGGIDTLHGDNGNDILDGGAGANHLWGDAGFDRFRVTTVDDHSVIEDYVFGDDAIQFDTDIAANYSALSFYDDLSGNAHITVGTVDITVVGVASASLNASQFEFANFV